MNESDHLTENEVAAYLEGNAQVRLRVQQHLRDCPQCSHVILVTQPAFLRQKMDLESGPTLVDLKSKVAVLKHALEQGTKSESNRAIAPDSNLTAKSQWGALGGLGGILAGAGLTSPVPALGSANHDSTAHPLQDEPASDEPTFTSIHDTNPLHDWSTAHETRQDDNAVASESTDSLAPFHMDVSPLLPSEPQDSKEDSQLDSMTTEFDVIGPSDQLSLPDEESPASGDDWHPPPDQ